MKPSGHILSPGPGDMIASFQHEKPCGMSRMEVSALTLPPTPEMCALQKWRRWQLRRAWAAQPC